jgi:hypothetical protein
MEDIGQLCKLVVSDTESNLELGGSEKYPKMATEYGKSG